MQIENSWKQPLAEALKKESYSQLMQFLESELDQKQVFYPAPSQLFEAFKLTPFQNVKVVLLGQDPYHGAGQAHGLSFSVNEGVAFPPSLRNIFKALQYDFTNYQIPLFGNLSAWATQGVLLLNATLSVRANAAGSHQKKGWEEFTDAVISSLSNEKENIVFLLWGNYAQSKTHLIDSSKHLILQAPHPSPLSAHRGFISCKHFSRCNTYLVSNRIEPITW